MTKYGNDILLLLCFFVLCLYLFKIYSLFDLSDKIANQRTDGFDENTIEFTVDTYGNVDFSFLNEEGSYAILRQVSQTVPIYEVVRSSNFFHYDEADELIAFDGWIYYAGSEADTVFELNPLLVNDISISRGYTLNSFPYPGLNYMVFISNTARSEYVGNGHFFIVGENDSVKYVYDTIFREMSSLNLEVNQINHFVTKVEEVHNIADIGMALLCVCAIATFCSITIIVFFWSSQFDDYRCLGFILGRKHCNLFIGIRLIVIFSSSFICAYFFYHYISLEKAIMLGGILGISTLLEFAIVRALDEV